VKKTLLSFLLSTTLYAQIIGTQTDRIESLPTISLFWLIIKLVFSLFVVGLLIWLVFFLLAKGRKVVGASDLIQILGTRAVAPNKYIQIVEVGDRVLIIGITDSSVSLLSEITDRETIQLLKTEKSKESAVKSPEMSFTDFLKRFIRPKEVGLKEKAQFLDKEYQRLKEI
jgi:flagellar protein FliO/FliZ